MIEIDHVTKSYRDKMALSDLTLTVEPGTIFGFLGPNGAGKTTAIRLICGLLRPDRGVVRVCGQEVGERSAEIRRQVGYIPDQPYLYDKLTGYEFLDFVGSMFGMSPADRKAQISAWVERLEVEPFLGLLSEGYSHGMRQRLVFCSALMHRPKVLVIDEPMVGLDPRSVRIVRDVLVEQARAGTAVFMSTHTLSSAEDICDRLGIIHRGKMVASGTVDEIRKQAPESARRLEDVFLHLTAD